MLCYRGQLFLTPFPPFNQNQEPNPFICWNMISLCSVEGFNPFPHPCPTYLLEDRCHVLSILMIPALSSTSGISGLRWAVVDLAHYEDRLHSSFQTFNTRALECLKPHERKSSHSQKDHTHVPGRRSVVVGGDQLMDFLNTVCTWGWTQRLFPTHCGLLRPTEHRQQVTWTCYIPRPTEAVMHVDASKALCHTIQAASNLGKSPSRGTRRGALFWWLWASRSNSKALHFLSHKT